MAGALAELLYNITSEPEKQKQLTLEEAKALVSVKTNCIRILALSAIAGAAIPWIVPLPSRLGNLHRFGLSVGIGFIGGIKGFKWSINSSVDQILALEGSRIQNELATIIIHKFPHDIKRIRRISKHFYQENFYDDATPDQLRFRWRRRNLSVDNSTESQRHDSSDDQSDSSSKDRIKSGNKRAGSVSKQVPINRDYNPLTNPFDCIFGGAEDESYHYFSDDTSDVRPKTVTRRSKRAQRRRRRLHRHELSEAMNT